MIKILLIYVNSYVQITIIVYVKIEWHFGVIMPPDSLF